MRATAIITRMVYRVFDDAEDGAIFKRGLVETLKPVQDDYQI
jgi:hypothetical protein